MKSFMICTAHKILSRWLHQEKWDGGHVGRMGRVGHVGCVGL